MKTYTKRFVPAAALYCCALILLVSSAKLISAPTDTDARSPIGQPPSVPILYFVDSTGDGGNVGSSTICDDGTGHCTLRAAMEAANLNPGLDGISIGIPLSDPGCNAITGQCTINLTRALPNISEGVGLDGPGPALLTVRRVPAAPEFRIFDVTTTGLVSFFGTHHNRRG